ncbi:unnamed protein product [Lepidochelys olivacea]
MPAGTGTPTEGATAPGMAQLSCRAQFSPGPSITLPTPCPALVCQCPSLPSHGPPLAQPCPPPALPVPLTPNPQPLLCRCWVTPPALGTCCPGSSWVGVSAQVFSLGRGAVPPDVPSCGRGQPCPPWSTCVSWAGHLSCRCTLGFYLSWTMGCVPDLLRIVAQLESLFQRILGQLDAYLSLSILDLQ